MVGGREAAQAHTSLRGIHVIEQCARTTRLSFLHKDREAGREVSWALPLRDSVVREEQEPMEDGRWVKEFVEAARVTKEVQPPKVWGRL